ncbi:glutathione-dependent reductase [Lonepinella koalarum]|uniref:glutathione S-transferase family protein n=1 Tax=Lonepinella koalarum TaxID=53417 RepID=UPI0011E47555|nr:glutathione S-transferase C-terminal domain-containing protein [Lonepinella koalarum]TYG35543.1 glutathione-dependent reductase [Lonepinella koalarum]
MSSIINQNEPLNKSVSPLEISQDGRFVRQTSRFITPFGDQAGQLPIESNRYRLLVSYACPWAHRQLIALKLLGLDKHISIGVVNPVRPTNTDKKDWAFDEPDSVLGIRYLSDIYLATDPDYIGRFTVPAVVDLTTKKVVNNDFLNLLHHWQLAWKTLHKTDAPNLYPEQLRTQIDELNDLIFNDVNNGVYKAGFATSQVAYEQAYDQLFFTLDKLEQRLAHSRYLFGDQITDSDIRLYVTLVRFDVAYYNGFKCNRHRLIDFPNLWSYARDLYQQDAFKQTTHFDHIKAHYHLSATINPYQILPKGPDLSLWNSPHAREKLAQYGENK